VCIVDPYIEDGYLERYGEVESDVYKAIEGADALILMTAHKHFRTLAIKKVKELMRTPIIVDGRRMFDQKEMNMYGFIYRGIGSKNEGTADTFTS
jgi:UDP-N-acetyl-D-mannosaminuronate dehydrogenase